MHYAPILFCCGANAFDRTNALNQAVLIDKKKSQVCELDASTATKPSSKKKRRKEHRSSDRTTDAYRNIIGAHFLPLPNRELVIVQKTPAAFAAALPDVLVRKVFGT